jgi:aspartyl-tRNA(Asn)/glutamyl-tRNA(Gln) amidotransferase subunit A
VFPLSYTLDHCGPLSWSVEDTALAMQVVAGHDPLDPASADVPVPDFSADLGRGITGLKLAYPRSFFATVDGISPEVIAGIDRAVQDLARLGATVEEIKLPDYELFNACGRLILTAEAYAVHEENLIKRGGDYGRLAYQRMMPGAIVSAADLIQALRMRRELYEVIARVLEDHDAIVTVNALAPAIRLDAFPVDATLRTPGHTIPFNVTGHPALAVPTGFAKSGLPIGLQIIGRPFDEPTVLRIGAAYETVAQWTTKRPQLELAMAG